VRTGLEIPVDDRLTSLVVNADDFGLSRGVNRGIVETHERGIVTSTSLMVNQAAAAEAAAYARDHPALDVGLHVELRRWRPTRWPWSSARSWERLQTVVARDLAAQLDRFRKLLDRDPSHIDSHKHRHRIPPLRPVFESVAQELDVPLRHYTGGIGFSGEFYGHDGAGRSTPDAVSAAALIAVLARLPTGITELGCHPGYPDGLRTWYREERLLEVRALCDEDVRAAVERLGIRLVSFRDLRRPRGSQAAAG
jgi:chitin disaccharide deacetylase